MKKTAFVSARPLAPARFALALLLAAPLAFAACSDDKDDPEPEEDNELITTVTYTLTPVAGSSAPAATITWEDLDGAGGAAPVITGGPLALRAGTTYTGTITLLDKTKTPAANVTDEVAKEKEDHLFLYEPAPTVLLSITRTDKDSKNLEVGLTTRLVTTTAATGTLKITLRHQPGTKNGNASPGDTDVEATVPVAVQ
ncbi:hypothetical protein SAMN02745146_2810 [Hymenobacter daecheongensis DSM 21074]|uniref:Type 1 periplasmic binding fold superfamily protein n=1 Tax=Hymenobacter daecheongensis DSM 21074 TaxID=1121955 RepID=A0A1M6I691_9BACT|nr:hypothetical protein [Hymenobacter daecheongensis]SHJ29969.1 hypothetical protein SAMN02745146_2810 [Hymenobacter daecheongensis DSM 21074]